MDNGKTNNIMTRTQIITRLRVEAIHCWPGCDIPEVDFLKYPHRHVFHIEARKTVSHDDRDIEIIRLGHDIRRMLFDLYFDDRLQQHDFGSASCEEIARLILRSFELDSCEVTEDGENGAIITNQNE